MKRGKVSRLLSAAIALSMTMGMGAVPAFADAEELPAEVPAAEASVEVSESEEAEVSIEETADPVVSVPEVTESIPEVETQDDAELVYADEAAVEDEAAPDEVIIESVEETDIAEADMAGEEEFSGYVLMNIPYDKFYEAEGVSGVDAVSSATVKTYNQTMAAGSYHAGYEAADPISDAQILGITYPVYVSDPAVLEGLTEVTDESAATIAVAAGKSSMTTKDVTGTDVLFASGDYAYYKLAAEPSNYKTLSGSSSADFAFSAVRNGAVPAEGMTAELTYGGHYTDIAFTVGAPEITDSAVVNAITIKADGETYALRHVQDIWRKTSLGWNWTDLDGNGLSGKTITNVTYYVKDGDSYGVYSYDVNVPVKMNPGESVEAAIETNSTITVSGLPDDIANAAATVATKVGRGETPVVIAESVPVENGKITTSEKMAKSKAYTVKIVSDNYADISLEVTCNYAPMESASIGGLTYFYVNTADDEDSVTYQAVVSSRRGTTIYNFAKDELTQVADTTWYYGVPAGTTPLSGTLYGYNGGTATTYKAVYGELGASADDSYDVISSATAFSGHHAKDIPSLVTYGTDANGSKAITGLNLGRSYTTVEAVPYVEAGILSAAGETLTAKQQELTEVVLKTNPMSAPSDSDVPVRLASASYTESRYGIGEFAIVPDDTVDGYVWSEYWSNVYAATISDGTNTVGAVHWIDLYGEAATSGAHYNKIQIALNNGTSVASNAAEVNRYSAFFDENTGLLKGGVYKIRVYAEGYDTLEAEVTVPGSAYVLMNIPYDKFYDAEGVSGVDAVSSATVKTYNQNMAAGSYHAGYEAADPISGAQILGVTYPVYVSDTSVLEGLTEITDESAATIAVASGKSSMTTKDVTGKDVLFASGDYAYYKLSSAPDNYKTLSGTESADFGFSAVKNAAAEKEGMTAELTYGGHYTDIAFTVGAPEITDTAIVNAITIKTGDETYALRHVQDIWRKTSLGWNWTDLDGSGLAGKTITNVTYYIQDNGSYGVYSYDVNVPVKLHADIEADGDSLKSVTVTGLPDDIVNPVATVQTKVGRGETPVVVAENVEVKNGKVATTQDMVIGTTYKVTVLSDNYADASSEFMMEFVDVKDPEPFYYEFIYWAVEKGITTGWADGTFRPMDNCNRAAVVTFLWRLAGSPEPAAMATFKDMPADTESNQDFRKAISWGVEKGITTGWASDNTFRPWAKCNRAAIVTFIWRYAGKPSAGSTAAFKDMPKNIAANQDFRSAISWAVEKGITTGWASDNTFRPWNNCNRLSVVTFLGRHAKDSSTAS